MRDKRRSRTASLGRASSSSGRGWRTSTAIPNAICYVLWLPLRFMAWLSRAIMQLTRAVIFTTAAIIGAFLVLSGTVAGWHEGLLGLICLACVGVVAFSVRPQGWHR